MSVLLLLYVQQIPEAVAMWRLQIKRSRVRFPHWNFFFHSFFLFVSFFSPFFFLHARSAISMLKHFSSNRLYMHALEFSTITLIYDNNALHYCHTNLWHAALHVIAKGASQNSWTIYIPSSAYLSSVQHLAGPTSNCTVRPADQQEHLKNQQYIN